jgi:hypothetical protein
MESFTEIERTMEEKLLLHLPWTSDELKSLLRKIIEIDETTKVDFKRELKINTAAEKAELLKDISAIANTYDHNYFNYGFLLIGVEKHKVIGSMLLENETDDHLRSTIDQIISHHIGPFIQTQIEIFNDDGKYWGAIIIPPTQMVPHVFVNDIANKNRGDIYVRRGTTTEKALPEDYARFFAMHLEELRYEIRHQIDNLRFELNDVKQNLNTASQLKQELIPETQSVPPQKEIEENFIKKRVELNLLQKIDERFSAREDPIKKGLMKEADKIQKLLASDIIDWSLQVPSKEEGEKLFNTINKEAEIYWQSLAKIILKDDEENYNEAIIKSLEYLAHYHEPPIGKPFTDFGQYIRYYPLIVSLYIIFTVGVFKKKDRLLKKISEIELTGKSFYEGPISIAYSLFFIRRAGEIFQTQYEEYPSRRWYDPISSYIKLLFNQKINIEDYFWNQDANFFVGEFLLSLLPLDVIDKNTGKPIFDHPSSGLYLYTSESISIIQRFLRNERDWIKEIFHWPLEDILKRFDNTATKKTILGIGMGFVSGAFQSTYPEKIKK